MATLNERIAQPEFIYFDLGNVLLRFSHQQAAEQIASVAGCDFKTVWNLVFGPDGIEFAYEAGELSSQEFYSRFCEATNTRPNYEALLHAGSAIFTPIAGSMALAARLAAAGYRLGILSNTCPAHWDYCLRQYPFLNRFFTVFCLSYEVRSMKPQRLIYEQGARMANCDPAKIFFCDDRPENVAGALDAGWDAVLFSSPSQIADELYRRGLKFNY